MSVLADLGEFVADHRPHGPMIGDATPPAWNGYLLTLACPCGVVFERWVTPRDAEMDLLRVAGLNATRVELPAPSHLPTPAPSPSLSSISAWGNACDRQGKADASGSQAREG